MTLKRIRIGESTVPLKPQFDNFHQQLINILTHNLYSTKFKWTKIYQMFILNVQVFTMVKGKEVEKQKMRQVHLSSTFCLHVLCNFGKYTATHTSITESIPHIL